MGWVFQRAPTSERGHCPCESAGFSCFHFQLQYFTHIHRPISLLSGNICETLRPRMCFLFPIKDKGEVAQRHNDVWLLSGLSLAEGLHSSMNCVLSSLCHMMDFLSFAFCSLLLLKKKSKKKSQFSEQQSTAFIRKLYFFTPQVPTLLDCCQKKKGGGVGSTGRGTSVPTRKYFLCFTTLCVPSNLRGNG